MNLIDVLRDDSLFCRIYIEDENKWIDGILLYVNLEKNVANIFLSSRHFKSMLAEGNKVIIKSLDLEQEYVFTGTVSQKIVSIRKQSITIKIDEIVKFENIRLFERFSVNYPAILKKVNTTNTASGILIDISSGGILIASPISYEPNTAINIEIYFATDAPITFVGRILRKSANNVGFSYGVIIEEIDNENAISLNRLIEVLVTEKRGILDELRVFKRINISIYIIAGLFLAFILSLFFKR